MTPTNASRKDKQSLNDSSSLKKQRTLTQVVQNKYESANSPHLVENAYQDLNVRNINTKYFYRGNGRGNVGDD